jgi:hypothetical protein
MEWGCGMADREFEFSVNELVRREGVCAREEALIEVYDMIWGYDTDKKWFSKCLYKN